MTVNITVNAVNDPPVAVADTYSTEENSLLTVNAAAGVLINDTDVEGDTISAVKVTDPSNGALTAFAGDGSFTYVPSPDFSGLDSFTYKVNDGSDDGNTVTVTITVNNAPVAFADSYSTDEDTTLTVSAAGVLSNDSDANGDSITAIMVTDPSNGILSAFNTDGSFTYVPNSDYDGPDSFTYKVNDGTVDGNTVTVTITVDAVNDAPTFTLVGNQTVSEDAGAQTVNNFLTNASPGPTDESGQTLSVSISNDNNSLFTSQPSINLATGQLTYAPAANANGTATVTVTLSDDGGTAKGGTDSSALTFDIIVNAVNDAPTFSLGGDQSINQDAGSQVVNNFLTNPSPGPANESGQVLSLTVSNDNNSLFTTQPSISLGTGQLTYAPAAGANGKATVSVTLSDNGGTLNGGTDSSTQTFDIFVNAPPTLNSLADLNINEDSGQSQVSLSGITSGSVNENQTLTVTATSDNTALIPSPTVSYNSADATGSLTLGPVANANSNANGIATITVTVSDGLDSTQQSFTVTVNAVNDAPTFSLGNDQTVNEDAGSPVVNNFLTNPSPGPANETTQTLSLTVTNNDNGLFSIQPSIDLATGQLTYTPAPDANGTATVTVTLSDDGGTANGGDDSTQQQFNIIINPVNDPIYFSPPPVDQVLTHPEDYRDVPFYVVNVDNDPLSYSLVVENDYRSQLSSLDGSSRSGIIHYAAFLRFFTC